ncbi:thymidine kinase [Deltaproteobacteria bacterium]|nr:thymidine kinase [Deltaproteobacteria bacterium]
MFHVSQGTGWVEVITGCMFSGKTEELTRRVRRAQYAKQSVIVFKPSVDTRDAPTVVASHAGTSIPATTVTQVSDIWDMAQEYEVIAVDEAQFFDVELVEVAQHLADAGKQVIIAGLDLDYRGIPFGVIPYLLAVSEYPVKLHAVCVCCGNPAFRSQRIVDSREQVLVGAQSAYEARCRKCWNPEPVFTRRENNDEREG